MHSWAGRSVTGVYELASQVGTGKEEQSVLCSSMTRLLQCSLFYHVDVQIISLLGYPND